MLSPELATAARNLEERLALVRARTRVLPVARWTTSPRTSELVPEWIKELLSSYSLLDGVLEYKDRSQPFVRLFRFFDEAQFKLHLHEGSVTHSLLHFDYLPFAYESDGSLWVISEAKESGNVFLLDHSAWDGGRPTDSNGLIFAASRLALLLVSMGISEASYDTDNSTPEAIIWYKARE